jgi:hypothetical protein
MTRPIRISHQWHNKTLGLQLLDLFIIPAALAARGLYWSSRPGSVFRQAVLQLPPNGSAANIINTLGQVRGPSRQRK